MGMSNKVLGLEILFSSHSIKSGAVVVVAAVAIGFSVKKFKVNVIFGDWFGLYIIIKVSENS